MIKWSLQLLNGMIKAGVFNIPVPLVCHWEITYRCNLNCAFCATRFNKNIWSPEITTDRAREIIDQLVSSGTKILNLVGGEPTCRDDLKEIIRYARSNGLKTAVTTNGVMDDSRREWLLEADIVRVSLEGAPELNSVLRKHAGKQNTTLVTIETIKYLCEHKKHPLIASTISAKTTERDIEYLVSLAREFNVRINFNPVGVGFSEKKENFTPEDREQRRKDFSEMLLPLKVSIEKIESIHRKYPAYVTSSMPALYVLRKGGLNKYGCMAMNTAVCIKPDGSIAMPCIEFPHKVVSGDDINAIYLGKEAAAARANQGKYWFCENCQLTCMISASSLVKIFPLFLMMKQYLPQVFKSLFNTEKN